MTTHGHGKVGSFNPTYSVWTGMKSRYYRKSNPMYKNYGGRGIKICDRWLAYSNFYADMGERPAGMTIDRINNDGDYEPSNCQWVTHQENCSHTRRTRLVTVNGETDTLSNTARKYDLKVSQLFQRLSKGMTPEQAVCV